MTDSAPYFFLIGTLLFALAISPGLMSKVPVTSSVIYLFLALLIGHHGLGILSLNSIEHAKLIETIAEITVIISLFSVGLKLRTPLGHHLWPIPISLASISMLVTIGLVALVAHYVLDLALGQSILLGAVLSPTDPVLASEVQLSHPDEKDSKKFILTAEGGMNDGAAFPFVMLGLSLMEGDSQSWNLGGWFLKDFIWAIGGGIFIGILSGFLVTKITYYIKEIRRSSYQEDFLTISSIALSYGAALEVHAYGFLAVFFTALTIRQLELRETSKSMFSSRKNLPNTVLSFNEQLERIFEVISVGFVGLLIDFRTLNLDVMVMAFLTLFFIRPIAIFLGTFRSKVTLRNKLFLSWFGVRGIGSIYYLFFAINQSENEFLARNFSQYTLWMIFFSILLHGVTARILVNRWH